MNQVNDIQALLDKYWEGETSLEEERLLKQYFSGNQIDPRFQTEAPLFRAIREEQAVQLVKPQEKPIRPVMYDLRVWAAAASVALGLFAGWWMFSKPEPPTMANQDNEIIVPTPDSPVIKEAPPAKVQTLMAEVPVSKPNIKKRPKTIRQKEKIDPEAEMAMEEIKAALALISSKIGKGRREAAKGAEHLDAVDKIFKKSAG